MEEGPLKCSQYSEHVFFPQKIITNNLRKLSVPLYAVRKAFCRSSSVAMTTITWLSIKEDEGPTKWYSQQSALRFLKATC